MAREDTGKNRGRAARKVPTGVGGTRREGNSRGTKTRQRIVGHATLLMYEKGYSRTSVEDVIKACGITKGSFYFHFSSKEELGYAVIENATQHVAGRLRSAMREQMPPAERLTAALEELQRIVMEADCCRGCILGNLALELSNQHDGFREKLAGSFQQLADIIAGPLAEMKENGELPADLDPGAFASYAVSAIEGGIMMSKVTRDPEPMRRCAQMLLNQVESMRRGEPGPHRQAKKFR
jgi:TetR/AcrR family transcriptional repressor of nem operon